MYQAAVKLSDKQIPNMYDCTMMIQTNPLFDNQIDETKNVAFSLKQEKDQQVKNVDYLTRQPTTIPSSSRAFPPRTTLLLLRGSSFSLVELPTFLPPSYKVQTRHQHRLATNVEKPLNNPKKTLAEVLADYHPSDKALLKPIPQWAVMIVAITFFTTCLLLVGVMLAFTSEYQDITIARVLNGSDGSRGINFSF